MRINIYSQEITSDVQEVEKTGTGKDGQIETFYGVRMMLESPDTLHHTLDDDDRSAVVFWLPQSKRRRQDLASALQDMADLVEARTQA